MKIKFSTNLVVNIIIAGIAIVMILPWLSFWLVSKTKSQTSTVGTYNSWENNLKPIDTELSESLPYDQYIKLKDSIKLMRSLRDGDEPFKGSFTLGNIGIFYASDCSTCSLADYWHHTRSFDTKKSYLALLGWTLSHNDLSYIDEGKFYVKNGQGYVRQALIDTSFKKADGSVNNRIHIKDVPVKFRYNHRGEYLLIPISNTQAHILVFVWGISLAFILTYLLYLISAFLRFIVDTSKGEIFTDKNVNRLKFIASSLVGFPVITYGLNYAMRVIFHSYFIPGVVVKDNLLPGLWMDLVLAVIFLLLYKAFRQGKLLKDEHDLTV